MQQTIDTMTRDISIHKDVEKELAKRSHFSQKVIQRLKAENKELHEKIEGAENTITAKHPNTFKGRNNSVSVTQRV
jgi:uncharacterized protein involved in exopolysaccharide biosynthesis